MVLATESAQLPRRSEFTEAAGSNEPSPAAWQFSAEPLPSAAATQTAAASSRPGFGCQPNKLGSYYCYNRTYDPTTGRWTTPDPAATPWGNLQDYVGASPLLRSDASGLFGAWIKGYRGAQRLLGKAPKEGFPTHNSITRNALSGSSVPKCLHAMVVRGATEIDKPGFLWGHGDSAALHVDDTRFLDQTQEWLEAVRDAGGYFQKNNNGDCKCLATLAYIAGMAVHTIQDFYHHSDWFFGRGGDVRDGSNQLIGLGRWNETEEGASRIRVGSGWRAGGAANGKPESDARVGPWHRDPWGDIQKPKDQLPPPPNGHGHLSYLLHVVGNVVTPHTSDYLNSVLGGIAPRCCCDGDVLSANHYQFNPGYGERALSRCFGPDAGSRVAKYAIGHKRHAREP